TRPRLHPRSGSGGTLGLRRGRCDLASPGGPPDLSHGNPICPAMPLNAGPAAALTLGTAKYFTDSVSYELFVCRDQAGLFALSASCTHAGATLKKESTQFYCPRHGATFDLNGE